MRRKFIFATDAWCAGSTEKPNVFFSMLSVFPVAKKFILVLALTGLSACAGAPTVNNVQQSLPPTTTNSLTLTLWHVQTGVAAKTLDGLIDDFQKANPNISIRVNVQVNENDLLRQGLAAIALNQPPDTVLAGERTLAEFARRGALVNLDPLLSENDRNDFMPGLLDAKPIINLPFDETAVVMYSNLDLLNAAKTDAPPRTWDQFANAARATTKSNVRGWVMTPQASVFCALLASRGGSVLNDAQTQVTFNDAGMKSLELIATLTKSGAAYLADAPIARDDFTHGRAALLIGTTTDLASIASGTKFQWGISHVPQNDPSHPATIMFGSQLAIFKSAQNNSANERERAAWLFARWLTQPAQSARWSRAMLTLPVRISARGLLMSDVPPSFQILRDGLSNPLPIARAMPVAKDAGLIDAALVDLWTSVANGTDPATALKNSSARINRILGQIQ